MLWSRKKALGGAKWNTLRLGWRQWIKWDFKTTQALAVVAAECTRRYRLSISTGKINKAKISSEGNSTAEIFRGLGIWCSKITKAANCLFTRLILSILLPLSALSQWLPHKINVLLNIFFIQHLTKWSISFMSHSQWEAIKTQKEGSKDNNTKENLKRGIFSNVN